ncbi:P-loop NTPase fold protein [Bradyrhizobium japonicum]
MWSEGFGKSDADAAKKAVGDAVKEGGELLKPKEETSPPKEIQALRDTLEQTLEELGITLVVLIDDLDRCLPRQRSRRSKPSASSYSSEHRLRHRCGQRHDQARSPQALRGLRK